MFQHGLAFHRDESLGALTGSAPARARAGQTWPLGSAQRLSASATVLYSDGKCPTENCQPLRACRQASSRATATKIPRPLNDKALLRDPVLSPST